MLIIYSYFIPSSQPECLIVSPTAVFIWLVPYLPYSIIVLKLLIFEWLTTSLDSDLLFQELKAGLWLAYQYARMCRFREVTNS